jgi:cytochrome c-type biogenesis protein CcmH/NrfG
MSAAAERTLRTYVRDHNEDPRAYILLGRGYTRRGWRPDALERFERAYRLDPSTRNDRNVLNSLVELSFHANTATRAQALVREMYGASAIEAVDRRLARRDLEDSDRARLERFRATLGP